MSETSLTPKIAEFREALDSAEGPRELHDLAHRIVNFLEEIQQPKRFTKTELLDECKRLNGWMLEGPSCYDRMEQAWLQCAEFTRAVDK